MGKQREMSGQSAAGAFQLGHGPVAALPPALAASKPEEWQRKVQRCWSSKLLSPCPCGAGYEDRHHLLLCDEDNSKKCTFFRIARTLTSTIFYRSNIMQKAIQLH